MAEIKTLTIVVRWPDDKWDDSKKQETAYLESALTEIIERLDSIVSTPEECEFVNPLGRVFATALMETIDVTR